MLLLPQKLIAQPNVGAVLRKRGGAVHVILCHNPFFLPFNWKEENMLSCFSL